MRFALCQQNPVIGDLKGNVSKIRKSLEDIPQAEFFVFPELFVTGYPPKDLLNKTWFIDDCERALEHLKVLSTEYSDKAILTGIPRSGKGRLGKTGLYNSAMLIKDGDVLFHQDKSLLPSYDVFDETRYFMPAEEVSTFDFCGKRLGLTICEDVWNPDPLSSDLPYNFDPVGKLASLGAELIINISASPFDTDKFNRRFSILSEHARLHGIPFLSVNQVGANDELIFDGKSMVLDKKGNSLSVLASFSEERRVFSFDESPSGLHEPESKDENLLSDIEAALILGIKDYAIKCGFSKAVIGLSGGIDSALTCALAVKALGADNVTGVTMPSVYSSSGSVSDSETLAGNLSIRLETIPIKPHFDVFRESLSCSFKGYPEDITEENLQARIRGTILMAFSNKTGALLLTTGNKSELAVGYCTLYGDMNGGLAVIADLPKTLVYKLSRHLNRSGEVIPEATIDKPPSAELSPGQKDSNTLPDYAVLDKVLSMLIEEGCSIDEVIEAGFSRETVVWIASKVKANEYKRRQAPPVLKITPKAFGAGRRFPIAADYKWNTSF